MKLTNMRMITPPPVRRSLSYVVITACLLFAFSFSTRAFFPTNARSPLGLFGKTHQKITDEAITELDQEIYSINNMTSTMKAAIEEIARESLCPVPEPRKVHGGCAFIRLDLMRPRPIANEFTWRGARVPLVIGSNRAQPS